MSDPEPVRIARRFRGPARSGNGGYTAGLLAGIFPTDAGTAIQVTLRMPPPLAVDLPVEREAQVTRLTHDGAVVAEAEQVRVDMPPVDPVSVADACEAEREYAGLRDHPFPTCFTCGTARDRGDGLCLRPGPVRLPADGGASAERRTACTWTPDPSLELADGFVRPEFVWAALDCPGGWTGDIVGRPMVLGRITASVDALARIGERHVVMGRFLDEDGRKTYTTTTIYDSDGRVIGRAQHVWVAVDPGAFND